LQQIRANLDSATASLRNRKAYLDAKKRELESRKRQVDESKADLDRRQNELRRRKQELDDWAARIDRRAAELNASRPTVTQPPPAGTQPPPGGRPTLPGFGVSVFGRGEGELQGGFTFPDAVSARGTIIINGQEYEWSARLDKDITSPANKLYRVQIWKFTCVQLGGQATAEIKGSETGAAGDAFDWVLNVNGQKVKIVVGIQFSGDKVRMLTVRKAF
jgi:hypothetical protein